MLRGEPYVIVQPSSQQIQESAEELQTLTDGVIASVRDKLLDGRATNASGRVLFPNGVTKLELEVSLNADDGFKVKVVVGGPDHAKP